MAEVLVDFDVRLAGPDGRIYEPQACGRERADGLWEGWIEFVAPEGEPKRTGRETTQPNRDDLMYWAQGLTATYLEGALDRVLSDAPRRPPHREPSRPAVFEEPGVATASGRVTVRSPAGAAAPTAVLDPLQVYSEGGIGMLRGQLDALSASQLRNIIRAQAFSTLDPAQLDRLGRPDLTDLIIRAVEEQSK